MVTTATNVVGIVTGQAGAAQTADGAAAGQDDSEFAQLLGGMSGDTAETTAVVAAKPVKAAVKEDIATPDAVGLSAEMLALCAIPMAPITPTAAPIPALIAADSGAQQGIAGATGAAGVLVTEAASSSAPTAASTSTPTPIATLAAAAVAKPTTPETTSTPAPVADTSSAATPPVATGTAASTTPASGTVTVQDMQWLRSGNQIVANAATAAQQSTAAKPGAANNIATAVAADTQVNAEVSTLLSDATSVKSPQQSTYQQVLAQTAPTVAAAIGQRSERELDEISVDASAAQTGISTISAQAQPAGTQLAIDDAAALDNSRHQLHAPVGTHQWAAELGNKLTMLATKDTQSATLYMTPADLGPVQVRIDMHQNQASVWFTAEHADTRSALEQSLPRLREMFTAQGMSLTDAGVFGDRSRQQAGYNGAEQGNSSATRFGGEVADEGISVRGVSLSMLDAYA